MLVLSTKVKERIVLPGIATTITLLDTHHKQAKMGFEAPKVVRVLRESLLKPTEQFGSLLLERDDAIRLKSKMMASIDGLAIIRQLVEQGADKKTVLATLDHINKGVAIEATMRVDRMPTGVRALLIENKKNDRKLLSGVLRMGGIEVETVPGGDDALLYLRNNADPDLILLDLNAPGLNCFDFAQAIRDQGNKSRIFMVTGADAISKMTREHRGVTNPLNSQQSLREVLSEAN